MTDYEVLGLDSSATLEEIKKRFHQRVKMNHPDKYDRDADQDLWNLANERMTQITEAYRRLSNKLMTEGDRIRREHEAAEAARREEESRQRAEAERQWKCREERLRREAEARQREEAERKRQAELDAKMKDSDIATAREYKAKLRKAVFVKSFVGILMCCVLICGMFTSMMVGLEDGAGKCVASFFITFGIVFALYPLQKGDSVEELKSRLDFAKTFSTDLELGRYLRKKNFD